jgi:hypothetical protein
MRHVIVPNLPRNWDIRGLTWRHAPAAGQAERLYNIALFCEKGRVQARLAYTFTSAFVLSYGDELNNDAYRDRRGIIDAEVSFRLTKNLAVFADVINLGHEPLDEYAGIPSQNGATERYWWTANFGINRNL